MKTSKYQNVVAEGQTHDFIIKTFNLINRLIIVGNSPLLFRKALIYKYELKAFNIIGRNNRYKDDGIVGLASLYNILIHLFIQFRWNLVFKVWFYLELFSRAVNYSVIYILCLNLKQLIKQFHLIPNSLYYFVLDIFF